MTQFGDSPASGVPVCECCGHLLVPYAFFEVVVPDSSYLHPDDSGMDGWRITYACCGAHADALVAAGTRSWVDEQLWSRKLTRVSASWNRTETTLAGIATRAGLTVPQLSRAIRWRMGHQRPAAPIPKKDHRL